MSPGRTAALLSVCALVFAAPLSAATGAEPVSFEHQDWELVCDNTRTCRAAGYQDEEVSAPISVLLTRKAGPCTAVTGQVALADCRVARASAAAHDDAFAERVWQMSAEIAARR